MIAPECGADGASLAMAASSGGMAGGLKAAAYGLHASIAIARARSSHRAAGGPRGG